MSNFNRCQLTAYGIFHLLMLAGVPTNLIRFFVQENALFVGIRAETEDDAGTFLSYPLEESEDAEALQGALLAGVPIWNALSSRAKASIVLDTFDYETRDFVLLFFASIPSSAKYLMNTTGVTAIAEA